MNRSIAHRLLAALTLTVGLGFSGFAVATAQDATPAALPTGPDAQNKSANGGYTSAKASLPDGPGSSPLEPYLVVWLIPVAGALSGFAMIWFEKRVQSTRLA